MNLLRNVSDYVIGNNSLDQLQNIFKNKKISIDNCIYFIDNFHKNKNIIKKLPFCKSGNIFYISTSNEPTNIGIDKYVELIKKKQLKPKIVVGIGGGSTLDTAKAFSVMINNKGKTSSYQGWDLTSKKGLYKVGIPTISGTGAESSRTCVLINNVSKIKLGINSNHSVFDSVILDPLLTTTVPRQQYFYTAMDTYFHSFESLNGNHRNLISDSYSSQAIQLIKEIFSSKDFKSAENRKKLMVASYLGGLAIAGSYVGVLHPISAGISTVLKTPHCFTNCLVMKMMKDFYPNEFKIFNKYLIIHNIKLPSIDFSKFSEKTIRQIYESTIIHSKPLINALGVNYKNVLNYDYFIKIIKKK